MRSQCESNLKLFETQWHRLVLVCYARLALAPYPIVLADAPPSALLAPALSPIVLADALSPRIRSQCKTCIADKDESMPPDLEEL